MAFSLASKATRPLLRSGSARTMATEKQLSNKMKSTKGIMKITSSMKMVSAAKLKGDETRLFSARPFAKWTTTNELTPEGNALAGDFDDISDNCLIVPLTTDKGLCGGVNSFVSRGTRNMVNTLKAQGKKASVLVVGDKGRSQMKRMFEGNIIAAVTEVVAPRNFTYSSALSSEIMKASEGKNFSSIVIVYNKFKNSATYTQEYRVLTPFVSNGEGESLMAYEFEPDVKSEVLDDLHEYLLSTTLHVSLMESAASEQSARMAAMENATKNAGEMVDRLTLQYNRARQTRITTELIEIISGASAIEG